MLRKSARVARCGHAGDDAEIGELPRFQPMSRKTSKTKPAIP